MVWGEGWGGSGGGWVVGVRKGGEGGEEGRGGGVGWWG